MRTLVTDAIVGVGLPTEELAEKYAEAGYVEHTPRRVEPYWIRSKLAELSEEQLQGIYEQLRHARDAQLDG